MRIANELKVPKDEQADLYYSLLLKDAGCSSNASKMYHTFASDDISAKRDIKKIDITRRDWSALQYALNHVATGKPFLQRVKAIYELMASEKQNARETVAIRCERGASMARLMGLPLRTAEAIAGLDEYWNGAGNPTGAKGEEIPLASRIMLLSQTLDVFYKSGGIDQALDYCRERSGTLFDPTVVKAASSLANRDILFAGLDMDQPLVMALALEPGQRMLAEGDISLDAVCQAFAQIVDAKSPFTYNHSNGVANAAVAIATELGFEPERTRFIRHAALLHDLGKLAVSNTILEKPGKPDAAEWQALREHPSYTWTILRSIGGCQSLAEVAASHHEKLNGTGYHRGLTAAQLPLESRILVVADIFDALSAKRPYRDSLPPEVVFHIMAKDVPHAIDADCYEALVQSGFAFDQSFVDLSALNQTLAQKEAQSRSVPHKIELVVGG